MPDGSRISFKKGILLLATEKCQVSLKTENPRPSWLIIDELNRANLDLAFGKIFTQLDLAYRNKPLEIVINEDGKKQEFVELHEWWLIETYREKGYGNKFLDFFEAHMKSQGYTDLVFYADHPAALAAFRRHGYTEGGYLAGPKLYVFYYSLEKSH